jgi:hypothetical protein
MIADYVRNGSNPQIISNGNLDCDGNISNGQISIDLPAPGRPAQGRHKQSGIRFKYYVQGIRWTRIPTRGD